MGMGGGGGQSQSQQGTGWNWSSGFANTNTTPNLYTWQNILPPWTQEAQKNLVPYLQSRARTGMTPQEEQQTWGGIRDTLEDTSQGANKQLSRVLATSGIGASSPAAAGAYSDLASDKLTQTSKAALDFAKMKMGARDTALGQMMTALYSPTPYAVGHTTTAHQ